MRRVRAAALVGAFFAALVLVGCQAQRTAEVSGTVTVDEKPLSKGSIGFSPIDGKGQTSGGEIIDGKYKATVGLGVMKVEIRYPKVSGQKKDYDAPGGKFYDTFTESLPAKFNNETELKLDVNAAKIEKNWDLTTK